MERFAGRSLHQLVAELATELEHTKAHCTELQGVSYDFTKFFDSLPHALIGPVLTAAGAPREWAYRYMQFCQGPEVQVQVHG